jgi:flagellar hook assembly protein FlgD
MGGNGHYLFKQNYPNPFNVLTEINYVLADHTEISLAIYDITGREIVTLASGLKYPGYYKEEWNGEDNNGRLVPSGVYFCRLVTGSSIQTKKMILIR